MDTYLSVVLSSFGLSGILLDIVLALSVIIVFLSFILSLYFLLRGMGVGFLKSLIKKSRNSLDDVLLSSGILNLLVGFIPGSVAYFMIPIFCADIPLLIVWVKRFSLAYMVLIFLMIVGSFLKILSHVLQKFKPNQRVAVNSVFQLLSLAVYLFGSIVIIAILLNKSPWVFISGLGALTAVLLLVFKDTIMGFVASLQLSVNKMVQVGDWIEMPQFGADGDVIEVSLVSVKVQNWDKTITSIPTSSLVTDAFKNWRGMTLAGGRRIKRDIVLDMNCIKFCNHAFFECCDHSFLEPIYAFYGGKDLLFEKISHNAQYVTNLQLMRRYMLLYLQAHKQIRSEMTCLVRLLKSSEKGLPLQFYAFSKQLEWKSYEELQDEIFEHFVAVLPKFDLKIFQLQISTL